uniref:Uncharacterized protein n=1 Tax=Tanacetum cinerariifolium TaxID=118510 RepID=A0A6L2L6A3_TANCI|nr:hypothetical protein [Tanacetum cinerariifolium]
MLPTGDGSDCEAYDSECVGECCGEFGGVPRKRCRGSIIGVDREEIDFGSFAVRTTVVENMASGFQIVRMKAFGFAGIEKNGQGIEKNGRGIEKNDRGIEMNGQMTVLRFLLDKCDAFYWFDGELQAAWYKHVMYEMYLSMNGDQRDVFVEEINIHELEILAQERLAYVEAEFENYKARMVLQLKREQSKYAVWRRISGFMMFLLALMLVLFFIVI